MALGAGAAQAAGDNGDNSGSDNNGGGDNSGGGDNNGSGDNSDNGSSNNNNANSNGNRNGNGNDNGSDTFQLPPLPEPPPRVSRPECSTPGQTSFFTSRDGKATLRVFPTMPSSLRITVAPNYDVLALPPVSGRLAGLLIYDVAAAPCGGGAPLETFPAEVNLTIHYTSDDVVNVEERIIRFSWLDPATNTWQPVEKQALDPTQNAIGATITRTGRYIVYEDP